MTAGRSRFSGRGHWLIHGKGLRSRAKTRDRRVCVNDRAIATRAEQGGTGRGPAGVAVITGGHIAVTTGSVRPCPRQSCRRPHGLRRF